MTPPSPDRSRRPRRSKSHSPSECRAWPGWPSGYLAGKRHWRLVPALDRSGSADQLVVGINHAVDAHPSDSLGILQTCRSTRSSGLLYVSLGMAFYSPPSDVDDHFGHPAIAHVLDLKPVIGDRFDFVISTLAGRVRNFSPRTVAVSPAGRRSSRETRPTTDGVFRRYIAAH